MNKTQKNPLGVPSFRVPQYPVIGNRHPNNTTFRFSSGNAGMVQRKIINHLLMLLENGFESLPEAERLELAGTAVIREVCAPIKNPIHNISQLRAINGKGCIATIAAHSCKLHERAKPPAYYMLPIGTRELWRYAVRRPKLVKGERL